MVGDLADGVSVILCCHNSAKRLPKTLEHLAHQAFTESLPWEVIVVDNASTDSTAEVAQKTWLTCGGNADFLVVNQPVPGLSYAREKGIAESKYGILVFCDDDNWLCPGYVQRAHKILRDHPEVALVGGWGEPEPEGTPPRWLKDFSAPYGTGPQGSSAGIVSPTMTFYGAGLVVRKRDYLDLISSGFRFLLSGRQGSRLTTGEDRELGHAMVLRGKKLFYDPCLRFRHFIPKERATWIYYRRMMVACVPAGLILQAYHLHVLNMQKIRPMWKNSLSWIGLMMVVSQARRAFQTAGHFWKKGYLRFWLLELWLVSRVFWTWLTQGKRFREAFQQTGGNA